MITNSIVNADKRMRSVAARIKQYSIKLIAPVCWQQISNNKYYNSIWDEFDIEIGNAAWRYSTQMKVVL